MSALRYSRRRVLTLIIIVALLAIGYFSPRIGGWGMLQMQNPARLIVGASAAAAPVSKKTGWLVMEDPDDPISVSLRDSVELALHSVGYAPRYSSEISQPVLDAASEGIIVTATELGRLGRPDALLEYARNGGILVFAVRPEVDGAFRSIYQQLGIYEHGYLVESRGFSAEAGLLTAEPYTVEGDWLYNSIIELHVREECTVYAVNDDDVPLIWSLDYGRERMGQILFMNNSLMTRKSTGGLLISLLARLKKTPLIYPVINARVFALNSFPLPSDVNKDFLLKLYFREGRAFLRDIWWAEMVRFSRVHGIPLTAGALWGYDSEDALHQSAAVINKEMNLSFYAKELTKYAGEIGFSGFNQKPLFFGKLSENMDFEPWSDISLAERRNAESLEIFSGLFPSYSLYAYLPPERMLDRRGYEMIRRLMPELQVICGDFNDHQKWRQNFEIDGNNIACFPVVTEGYDITWEDEWDTLCIANALGVVSHAFDVSNLLLETDPENSWNIISKRFFGFAGGPFRETGHLDGMTVTEASLRLRRMLALDAETRATDGLVSVSVRGVMPEKAYFMLHCPGKTPVEQSGVTIVKIGEGRYFIASAVPGFTLELLGK